MIKLVVGVSELEEFYQLQQDYILDYQGTPANAVRTRFAPKRAEEVLNGGSLYRVIKNRIQCRQKILGFEQIESADRGTQCLIMVDAKIIQTVSTAKRPFQGWRYFEPASVPKDRGLYVGGGQREEIPTDLAEDLKELGLL